jgi:P4 family phage/plasmid primase-like protien
MIKKKFIIMSVTETESIYEKYKNEFKYSSNNWYYYSDHKWNLDKNGDEIKKKIGELDDYTELFFCEKFEDELDENDNLLHFLNGVYDLDKNEFRKGIPEDNISMTTGINFIEKPTEEDNEKIKQVEELLNKILPIEKVRNYVLTLLASFLHGQNKEQKFHIWTGSGSNGKSTLIDLYKKTIGQYYDSSSFNNFMQGVNVHTKLSEIFGEMKGKRFISLDEDETNMELNSGFIKKFTCGHEITASKLYSNLVRFKPQFKLVLTCNELPTLSSYDGGTLRRISVVEFVSKFCDEPNPKKSYEFQIDCELENKLDDWSEAFMYMLIQYYQNSYNINGLIEPEVVKLNTEVFHTYNLYTKQFVEKYIRADPLCTISIDDIFGPFRSFMFNSELNPSKYTMYSRRVFENCMNNILGQCDSSKKWNGWKLISDYNSQQLTETSTAPPPPPPQKLPMRPSRICR